MIYWREPLLLWLILSPLVLLLVSSLKERKRQAQLVDAQLIPWIQPPSRSANEWLNPLLLSAVWVFLCIAVAGPRTPQFIPNDLASIQHRVMIVLDHSDSMRAKDASGLQGVMSRIAVATDIADSWFDPSEPTVETGLIAFSGRAHWLLKPSVDNALIQHFLAQGDELLLPTLGSNLVDALSVIQSFPRESDTQTHIVLLTDGDVALDTRDNLESALLSMQASMPMTLSLIGFGGTEPTQVPGHPLANTQMNSAFLKSLASLHQDFIFREPEPLRGQPLMEWLNIESRRITPENVDRVVWHEWFSIPLLLAVVFLLVLLYRTKTGRTDG